MAGVKHHPHVYPQVEWAIPASSFQQQSIAAVCLVVISRPADGRRLSWPAHRMLVTQPPLGEQSIVITMYVCVFVCLQAYLRNIYQIFLCMLPLSWLSPPLVVSRYVILALSQDSSTWPPSWSKHSPHAALDVAINGTCLCANSRAYFSGAAVCAHNVPACVATRKWRVLKVTPRVVTLGAESAVCDCFVCVSVDWREVFSLHS